MEVIEADLMAEASGQANRMPACQELEVEQADAVERPSAAAQFGVRQLFRTSPHYLWLRLIFPV